MFSLSHNVCCKNWVRTIYILRRECLYKPINAPSRTGKIPSKLSTVSVWESRLGKWISIMREQNLDWDEESQGVEVTQHRTERGGQTGHQRERNTQEVHATQGVGWIPQVRNWGLPCLNCMRGNQLPRSTSGWCQAYLGQVCSPGSFPFIGLKGTPAYQPMTGKLWVCHLDRKTQSRVRDTEVHQAPLSMGFSRQGCWRGLPCPPPGDLPDPGIEPVSLSSPALANSLPLVPSGKPCCRLTIP